MSQKHNTFGMCITINLGIFELDLESKQEKFWI